MMTKDEEIEYLRNQLSRKDRKITALREMIDWNAEKIASQRSSLKNRREQTHRLQRENDELREELESHRNKEAAAS